MRKAWLLAAVVCLAVVLAMAHELANVDMNAKDWAEFVKDWAEALAIIIGGGAFYLYRSARGAFTHNLSVSLECRRTKILDTANHCLAVTAKLSKGDRYSIELHDAQVRVSWPDGKSKGKPNFVTARLIGLDRRSYNITSVDGAAIEPSNATTDAEANGSDAEDPKVPKSELKKNKTVRVAFSRRSKKLPFLRLAPGDQTSFSCFVAIPSNEVCAVELAILGRRLTVWAFGQWRASAVSMPSDRLAA